MTVEGGSLGKRGGGIAAIAVDCGGSAENVTFWMPQCGEARRGEGSAVARVPLWQQPMWPHIATLFAHAQAQVAHPWGWWHKPHCCCNVNDASKDRGCGNPQRAGGVGGAEGERQ